MDLRSLIAKMDAIEQAAVLDEAENIMERIRNADVMATAKISDEAQRIAALGKLATDNGYPGMFDPTNGKYVKADGTYSFTGPSEAEVKQLELHGLLPPNAETSSWLGMRGRDQQAARTGSQAVMDRDAQVDRATALIKKALTAPVAAPAPAAPAAGQSGAPVKEGRYSIASVLIESFGYDASYLAESITKEEHLELKKIMASLDAVKNDEDVAVLKEKYKNFIEKRDALLARINELINTIKTNKGTAKPATTKESVQLAEDAASALQKADDFVRSAASGMTLGFADNLAAKVKSMIYGTKYADELKHELEHSAEAGKRSPNLSLGGEVAGTVALPGGWLAGLGYGAANVASDKFIRDPHNVATLQAREKELAQQPVAAQLAPQAPSAETQQLQSKLKASGIDIGKFGVDGKFGPNTITAIQAYKEKNKLPSDVDAIAQLLGEKLSESIVNEVNPATAERVFGKMLGTLGKEAGAALGDIVRVGGRTFEKYPAVPGKYIEKSTGKLVDAEEVASLKAAADAAIKPAVSAAEKGAAGAAEKGAASAGEKAATGAVEKGAEKAAADAAEKGFLEKFGFKAGRAYAKTRAAGGKALAVLTNKKLLALLAALAAFGYFFNQEGNIVPDAETTAGQGSKPDEVSAEEKELCKLLQQLVDSWPADAETEAAVAASVEIGAKCELSGQGAKPAGGTPLERYYDELGTR